MAINLHFIILTQNTLSDLKIKPENSKNYVFWTNFKQFPQIWTSSSPFPFNIIILINVFLISGCLAKISF